MSWNGIYFVAVLILDLPKETQDSNVHRGRVVTCTVSVLRVVLGLLTYCSEKGVQLSLLIWLAALSLFTLQPMFEDASKGASAQCRKTMMMIKGHLMIQL